MTALPSVKRGTIESALIHIIVIMVIVVLGFGSWWAYGRTLPLAGSMTVATSGEPGRYPTDPLAPAVLSGVGDDVGHVRTVDDLDEVDILTPAEEVHYVRGGTERVRLRATHFDDGTATVLLAMMSDARAADSREDALAALQRDYGFDVDMDAPPGVTAGLLPTAKQADAGGRAHYTSGDVLVRVEFRGNDDGQARAKFRETLDAQIARMPPDG